MANKRILGLAELIFPANEVVDLLPGLILRLLLDVDAILIIDLVAIAVLELHELVRMLLAVVREEEEVDLLLDVRRRQRVEALQELLGRSRPLQCPRDISPGVVLDVLDVVDIIHDVTALWFSKY